MKKIAFCTWTDLGSRSQWRCVYMRKQDEKYDLNSFV